MRTILSGSVIFFLATCVAIVAGGRSSSSFRNLLHISRLKNSIISKLFGRRELEEEGEKKFQAPKRQKVGFYRTTDPLEWLPSNLSFFFLFHANQLNRFFEGPLKSRFFKEATCTIRVKIYR